MGKRKGTMQELGITVACKLYIHYLALLIVFDSNSKYEYEMRVDYDFVNLL